MFMKICPKCKTKHEYRKPCPNGCMEIDKQERNRIYDRDQRKNSAFYKSKQWVRLTAMCKARFNGIDIYQLYKYKRVVPGILSHHIEEVTESPEKRLNIDNLIYLSDASHREIHKMYNKSKLDKRALQKSLKEIVSIYLNRNQNALESK